LTEAVISKAFLVKANLQNANLSSSVLDRSTLDGADLRGATFVNAVITGITGFETANLEGADFTDALIGAWLSRTLHSLSPVCAGCQLTGSRLEHVIILQETRTPRGCARTQRWPTRKR
jgi:uncharacterized protein YjbI with pentapeptide repeats